MHSLLLYIKRKKKKKTFSAYFNQFMSLILNPPPSVRIIILNGKGIVLMVKFQYGMEGHVRKLVQINWKRKTFFLFLFRAWIWRKKTEV